MYHAVIFGLLFVFSLTFTVFTLFHESFAVIHEPALILLILMTEDWGMDWLLDFAYPVELALTTFFVFATFGFFAHVLIQARKKKA